MSDWVDEEIKRRLNIMEIEMMSRANIVEVRMGVSDFTVKDSGQRQHFDSGMQRDVTEDKIDYTLAFDGPMFERYAKHLTLGAKKYSARNWMKANSATEMDRFRQSAVRHFVQWLRGDTDEDHAAAVIFNINGYEFVRAQIANGGVLPGQVVCKDTVS